MPGSKMWRRLSLAALAMALLAIAACGENSTPTASSTDQSRLTSPDSSPAVFSFGSAVEPAAKKKKEKEEKEEKEEKKESGDRERNSDGEDGDLTAIETIGPEGGRLTVKHEGPEKNDDGSKAKTKLEVEFQIPRGALSGDEQITMEVKGYWLSELEILFTPAGLDFDKDARLQIKVERDRVDLDPGTLHVIHTSAEGEQVVDVDVEVTRSGNVVLNIRVPGFSRYGLGE